MGIIGESVKNIPVEITDEYPVIPWKAIAECVLVYLIHHYWDTEVDILWKTIQESVPQLKNIIKIIIKKEKQNK